MNTNNGYDCSPRTKHSRWYARIPVVLQRGIDFHNSPVNAREVFYRWLRNKGLKHLVWCALIDNAIDVQWKKTDEQLFWEHVDKSGECWLWKTSVTPQGYGMFAVRKQPMGAHRASWVLNVGPIPDGLFVLHKCDVRRCVRPDHLFLGDQAENVRDMIRKGRHVYGERVSQSRLVASDVLRLRELYATGNYTADHLSEMFGVSRNAAYAAATQRTWKHVTPVNRIASFSEDF